MIPWAIKVFKKIPKEKLGAIALIGLLGNLIPAFLFAKAETGLGSSITGVLNGLTPLFTFIVGALVFGGKLKFGQFAGLLLGFVGTLGLSFIGSDGDLGQMNYYALLVVLASLCYALSANILKSKLQKLRPIEITAMAMAIIGPMATVYLFSTDFLSRLQTEELAWQSLGYMAILGIVGTAIALVFFNKLIQMTSAVFATSVTYLIPIVAIAWGLLDGEKIFAWHYVGMVLILGGIFLVNKFRD
jgi:drug/metabolite transporter (DMT)-like permease